jgi:hypothetical protein
MPLISLRGSNPERRKTGMGLVSRVSPVQTALRNCTRDEGRSFEVGNQVLISSHRKLRRQRDGRLLVRCSMDFGCGSWTEELAASISCPQQFP